MTKIYKNIMPVQRFKYHHVARNYFMLGVALGVVPYLVHMQGWLR